MSDELITRETFLVARVKELEDRLSTAGASADTSNAAPGVNGSAPETPRPEVSKIEKLLEERRIARLASVLNEARVLDPTFAAEVLLGRGLTFDEEGEPVINGKPATAGAVRASLHPLLLSGEGARGTGSKAPHEARDASGEGDLHQLREASLGHGPIPYAKVRRQVLDAKRKGLL